jgi:hypothetical protein
MRYWLQRRYWLQESVLREILFLLRCVLPHKAQRVSFYNGVAMEEVKTPFWKA